MNILNLLTNFKRNWANSDFLDFEDLNNWKINDRANNICEKSISQKFD